MCLVGLARSKYQLAFTCEKKTFIRRKPTEVLNRLTGSRSMLSNNFKQGILVSASKPVEVLNKVTSTRAML